MSKYLIKTTEYYRCDSAEEAKELVENAKKSNQYTVVKSTDEIKNLKQKGEIIDSWHRVSITKEFNQEKEPISQFDIEYIEEE